MNIKDIKLNSHNPRDITPEQFAKLKKSLQEFPQMLDTRPLVIDENNVVLGGNMRLRVLQDLGFEDVPVKQVTGWTEEQKKEFIVKDNLSYGMWDWEMLANEWDAEQLEDWGLDIPNFEEDYSDKNNEISLSDLGDESSLIFKFNHKEYLEILELLNSAKEKLECDTNEQTLLKLLKSYE